MKNSLIEKLLDYCHPSKHCSWCKIETEHKAVKIGKYKSIETNIEKVEYYSECLICGWVEDLDSEEIKKFFGE